MHAARRRCSASSRCACNAAELSLTRVGQNHLHGEILAGAVRATWKLQIDKRGIDLRVQVPDAPIADFYAVVGASIPELARAQIEGRAGAELSLALPTGVWRVLPRIEGFSVSGLGTEALLGATPLLACARPTRRADAAAPFGVWLPRAVVAAEDQRYSRARRLRPGRDARRLALGH